MDTGDEPIDLESENFRGTNPVQITPYDFGPGFWFIALWRLISVYGRSSYLNSNLSLFNGGPVNRVDYLEIFQKIMKPGCWIFSEKRRPSSDLQQAAGHDPWSTSQPGAPPQTWWRDLPNAGGSKDSIPCFNTFQPHLGMIRDDPNKEIFVGWKHVETSHFSVLTALHRSGKFLRPIGQCFGWPIGQ